MAKTVLITGSSLGIGLGVAKCFLKAGYNVASCSEKTWEEAPACQELLKQYGEQRYFYQKCDVTKLDEIKSFVDNAAAHFGAIDTVVSNAGANVFKGVDCDVDTFEFNFDLNLRSHWYVSKCARPYLEKSHGTILITASNHAFSTIPGCAPYNITKRALLSLVQSITIEWGPAIRAVAVAPGFIDTEGNQAWFDSHEDPQAVREETVQNHPVKRLGTVEDIGHLCVFLASDEASFIAGTTILVDGGRSCLMQDSK